MTESEQDPPAWHPVSGDPYAPVQQPGYGHYSQQPYGPPYLAPQYPPYLQPQYPPQGYPAPYPPAHTVYGPDPRLAGRPGTVLASAVLAYVAGGLLILAGALLLLGASVIGNVEDAFNRGTSYGGELAADGLINFAVAGLLIAGGVMITGRNPTGRVMLSIGGAVVVIGSIYWLVRFNFVSGNGIVVYALLFMALAIVALSLLWSSASRGWLDAAPPR